MNDKRFQIIYSQGAMEHFKVIVDTETGVQYLAMISGYAGGLTPLLDRDGKPILASAGTNPDRSGT